MIPRAFLSTLEATPAYVAALSCFAITLHRLVLSESSRCRARMRVGTGQGGG